MPKTPAAPASDPALLDLVVRCTARAPATAERLSSVKRISLASGRLVRVAIHP